MKRFFLFLTAAAVACCAACSDDPEVAESNLSLLEDNVTFDMFGGRSVLEITADSPWTVSCDDDWCRTNVAEGSHTKKIVLTVDQSFLPEERTTAVRFYAAGEEKHTVTVTQEKFEPILVLAENGADITVYGAGSEPALNLRASVAWKIEGATDWCAVSQSEGTKSSVVKLLLTDDGEGVRPRSATLTVSSEMEGVEPQQVTVVQRSTGANTVVVRAGETRAFPARRTDGAYVKGVAADWVWTTDAELLSGLDYDASRNEIICTAAKSKQGSGLVALFDAGGAVVWSWLVWVVDKMPSDVTVGGIAWQDRNVGAEYHSTDPKACVQDFRSYGLFYQWGRKEPFIGAKILSKNKLLRGACGVSRCFRRDDARGGFQRLPHRRLAGQRRGDDRRNGKRQSDDVLYPVVRSDVRRLDRGRQGAERSLPGGIPGADGGRMAVAACLRGRQRRQEPGFGRHVQPLVCAQFGRNPHRPVDDVPQGR